MRPGSRLERGTERGYSVGELVVTMVVAGLVLAGLGTVVLSLTQGASTLNKTTGSSADVRLALEAMSRMLRVAFRPPGEPSAGESSVWATVGRPGGGGAPPAPGTTIGGAGGVR